MSAASCLLTEDQFLCSICLDVFTDPVTTPCGHNFCNKCITEHWDVNVPNQCPNCKEVFYIRPELRVNTFISEMALKSCLLIDPVENLEGRVCMNHDKLLELFCKTDQMCVCMLCTYSDHKAHDKAELKETEAEIQQMIQKRRLKLQEIKRSVELSKERADRETAEGVQVFTALKESVERGQAEFIRTIKEKQRRTEKQAEDFIKELEQEISELKKRSSEVEQLSLSEDHLHLIQSFSSLNTAPPTKDWREVSVRSPSHEGTVVRAVIQLEETLIKQMKKFFEAQLKRVQQYAVDVTLDPDIVHPKPTQSNDKQQVNERHVCRCVLSKQGFTSGRFYFEVQVSRWSTWTLGVTTESNVKREITLSTNNGFWTLCLKRQGGYHVSTDPSVRLPLKSRPEKVGVFVDYEEGLVCFYDVDTAALIYSFTSCSFTDKLHPFFSPCIDLGSNPTQTFCYMAFPLAPGFPVNLAYHWPNQGVKCLKTNHSIDITDQGCVSQWVETLDFIREKKLSIT
uniref:E3 ubiquitin-protein ligase TRIM11-like n=1 Tax=Seriola dumerili TaxID=41447 RepID=A0A3B4UXE9_SERDU